MGESPNGSQRAKFQATEGNGNRAKTERPRTRAFLRLPTAFYGFTLSITLLTAENAIQAIFDGFTAHGLKARNGSRTRQGSPKADRKRSRAGATTENTQNGNRFVNHSVNQNPTMHTQDLDFETVGGFSAVGFLQTL